MTPDPHDAEAVWRSPMMQPERDYENGSRVTWQFVYGGRWEPDQDAVAAPAPRTFPVNFASRAHTVPDPDADYPEDHAGLAALDDLAAEAYADYVRDRNIQNDAIAANAQRYRSAT